MTLSLPSCEQVFEQAALEMFSRKTHVAQNITQEVNVSNHTKILPLGGNALMNDVIVVPQPSQFEVRSTKNPSLSNMPSTNFFDSLLPISSCD
jgi:hypothetical protein